MSLDDVSIVIERIAPFVNDGRVVVVRRKAHDWHALAWTGDQPSTIRYRGKGRTAHEALRWLERHLTDD